MPINNNPDDDPPIPNFPAIVAAWLPDGLELPHVRQRMPSYERPVDVPLHIRARGARAAYEEAKRIKCLNCDRDLRQMLGGQWLVLVAYRPKQLEQPIIIPASAISLLHFDFDCNTVLVGDDVLIACCVYPPTHPLAQLKPPTVVAFEPSPPIVKLEVPPPILSWIEQHTPADAGFEATVPPTGFTYPGDSPAEARTRNTLLSLMRADLGNKAQRPKPDLKTECRSQCGEISDRAFEKIWDACIAETGAVAYKKTGPRGPHTAQRRPK